MSQFWCVCRKRRIQRQLTNPIPETQPTTTGGNPLTTLDLLQSGPSTNKNNTITTLAQSTAPKPSSIVATPGAGNSNSLPGHQSGRSKLNTHHLLDQQPLNILDNLNSTGNDGDSNINISPSSALSRKKNLSTSDLDPFERKKQAALAKVEAKLDKAQRLYQKAQQNVEQEISDFLRVTTIPNTNNEISSSRTTNATFDKRIRTLQDTKKELEKKIANYHTDISRIQAGEIPHNYASSKDIFSNIKSTAAKVAGGSLKHRSGTNTDQAITVSTPNTTEQTIPFHYPEPESHYLNPNLSTPLVQTLSQSPSTITTTFTSGQINNNQNLLLQNQHSNIHEPTHSTVSSSVSNEIGNSQFYIDSSLEHIYDSDKSSRKHDTNIPADGSTIHDNDKSPLTTQRRFTDDSLVESNDRTSDQSVDDRCTSSISKRNIATITMEYQQLNTKLDSMQKIVDRYETKINEMQKQIELLIIANDTQREQNERLNNELTDLTDLHQMEMSSIKTDLKNLEERLLYKFNDYWNELLEKLDKLDTRTAKVEQTQTHSLETEENTHRIISKLVNIVLTVFAIILLILSTIKNLVQSRVHAMTLLILVIVWITFHYLPQNYFQTTFLKNFPNMFKRTS
ncbi:unnamed protein product [Rotaria sp. Silwood1]|nr:unnamed protein product [Rotaria sp. Silwood1]CAF4678050.1 unnamed protein product [Rotaria sp. Silwood1]CAF4748679.1 unnamed protein product [Rotaria sp. Silwood1]